MYTLWISLPTQNAAGDITITNGLGKFYTFYWGVGTSRDGQLSSWLDSLPFVLDIYDRSCIERAVLDGRVISIGNRNSY